MSTEPATARNPWSLLFTVAIVVVLGAALWQSLGFGFRAGLFPWAIGFPVLALSVLLLIIQAAGKDKLRASEIAASEPGISASVAARRTAAIMGWIAGFLAAIWLLGFTIGGTLVTFVLLKFGSRERWPITLALTAGAAAFVYLVFERALNVPFPPGELLVWLGLA